MKDDINKPRTWPGGIVELDNDALARLGVGQDGYLYWDGKRLQTETRLGSFERGLALAVALSTVLVATAEVVRIYQDLIKP